jgi:hypothetical protein
MTQQAVVRFIIYRKEPLKLAFMWLRRRILTPYCNAVESLDAAPSHLVGNGVISTSDKTSAQVRKRKWVPASRVVKNSS